MIAASRTTRRCTLIVGPMLLTAALLGGCGPTGNAVPSASPGSSASAASPTASGAPSSTPPAQPGTPVTLGCDELLTPQAIYDFNPNFGLTEGYRPESGSLAAEAVAAQGIACRWTNQTSGDTIDVSLAQPAASRLAQLRSSAAGSGDAVPGLAMESYFQSSGGVGTVQAFTGPYWLTATSVAFFEGADARQLIDSAAAVLG